MLTAKKLHFIPPKNDIFWLALTAIRPLPDDQRLAIYDAIMDYAFCGKEPEDMSPILNGYFILLRPNIDSSAKRYSASVENGKKGGRPRKEPSKNLAETQEKPSENQKKEKEKEKEKEKDDKESAPPAPSPPSPPPVITFPLNDGSEYGVTEKQCREWAGLYPSVDILQQLRNMRGWLDSNEKRRKTRQGINRFITGWLSREQNQGRSGHSGGEERRSPIEPPVDVLKGFHTEDDG